MWTSLGAIIESASGVRVGLPLAWRRSKSLGSVGIVGIRFYLRTLKKAFFSRECFKARRIVLYMKTSLNGSFIIVGDGQNQSAFFSRTMPHFITVTESNKCTLMQESR
jgi:hypothetical protein